MYKDDYFYGLIDLMHFNVYASLLKEHIKKEERVIIKVFKKGEEIVIIETNNFVDTYLKDTRGDKTSDLMTFDLTYLHVLERYYSDYEIPNMVYEYIEGVGAWYRVKIPNFFPSNKLLKPFFQKKPIKKDALPKYAKTPSELKKLEKFYSYTKGLISFTKPCEVKRLFAIIEQ